MQTVYARSTPRVCVFAHTYNATTIRQLLVEEMLDVMMRYVFRWTEYGLHLIT